MPSPNRGKGPYVNWDDYITACENVKAFSLDIFDDFVALGDA